jgi:hypothetical protein
VTLGTLLLLRIGSPGTGAAVNVAAAASGHAATPATILGVVRFIKRSIPPALDITTASKVCQGTQCKPHTVTASRSEPALGSPVR